MSRLRLWSGPLAPRALLGALMLCSAQAFHFSSTAFVDGSAFVSPAISCEYLRQQLKPSTYYYLRINATFGGSARAYCDMDQTPAAVLQWDGSLPSIPATSCAALATFFDGIPTGDYWIAPTPQDIPVKIRCMAQPATPCPSLSQGTSIASGCTCSPQMIGKVKLISVSPFYNNTCSPPCPSGTTGVSVKAGCTYNVAYLIVGGGGAAGYDVGGGGGGGGFLNGTASVTFNSTYSVIVGQGGQSSSACGGNSSFDTFGTAVGGGGGGSYTGYITGNGLPGGSGGGAGGGVSYFGGAGISGQGNKGGNGCAQLVVGSTYYYASSSGGGAGGPGIACTANDYRGYDGGPGRASNITGNLTYYAGGGGGGGQTVCGKGGIGGGGDGNIRTSPSVNGANGAPNTGGGAGGSASANSGGAWGGSGIVIISYTAPAQIAMGGTVTSYVRNGAKFWVHSFKTVGASTLVAQMPAAA